MSLAEISDILAGPAANHQWPQVVADRIESLSTQIEHMQAARSFLQHVLDRHPDAAPDGCGHYEALIHHAHGSHDHPAGAFPPGQPSAIRRRAR
ncbi:MAG TPA: hypothetical protein VMR14_04710 [Streptosporangiaceae bacterium]|jgi:hypothetical protein|nr:hypothetical protein [Streptosporangiaceae bacterium]